MRRSLLTSDRIIAIRLAFEKGLSIMKTAELVKVSSRTLFRWLARGRELHCLIEIGEMDREDLESSDRPYLELMEQVLQVKTTFAYEGTDLTDAFQTIEVAVVDVIKEKEALLASREGPLKRNERYKIDKLFQEAIHTLRWAHSALLSLKREAASDLAER